MAVEGYQGYVAPIQGGTSYAQALQERVKFIQDQQRENIASIIANQQKKNEFRLKQLESLYKFRTNGWGEVPIKAFGEMRDKVSRKMKSGGYADIEDFYSDLSKLSDTHAFFSNHYETVKPVLDETAKLMQDPGRLQDKTRKPIDTVETYGEKYENYLNLGMTGIQVGEDLSMTYIGQDGNRVSVYDNPIASNTSYFGPLLALNFVDPKIIADEYTSNVEDFMDRNMPINESKSKVRSSLITAVEQNPAWMNSAQALFDSKNLKLIEGEPGPVDVYVDAVMDLLPFGRKRTTVSTARSTGGGGGGGGGTTKPDPLLSIVSEEVNNPATTVGAGIPFAGWTFGNDQKYYEYTFPAGFDDVNLSDYVSDDTKAEFDNKVMVSPRTVRFSDENITIVSAESGNKDLGEINIPYGSAAARQIEQTLRDMYKLDIESWRSGQAHTMINQLKSGASPMFTGTTSTAAKPSFNLEVKMQ